MLIIPTLVLRISVDIMPGFSPNLERIKLDKVFQHVDNKDLSDNLNFTDHRYT